jgi:hypothetical protein
MDEFVDVALEGGPKSMPTTVRLERSRTLDDTIKVEHLGGYEHFLRVGDESARNTVIFRWTGRTKIAE